MIRSVFAFCLLASPAAAACPPNPAIDERLDALLGEAQAAPDQGAAQIASGKMWELWLKAPDEQAQDWLDEGMGRMRLGDTLGARAAFDALVDYCPDYAEGWNQRAFLSFSQGEFDPALADLDQALALNPRHIGALTGKGLTLIALGRIADGQDVIRAALELNPWLGERRYLELEPEARDL